MGDGRVHVSREVDRGTHQNRPTTDMGAAPIGVSKSTFGEPPHMARIGGPRNAEDLKRIVDRRLANAREDLAGAETDAPLDAPYLRGQIHELATMQDLLCIVLDLARTGYASTK